jgi:hypothetical protein
MKAAWERFFIKKYFHARSDDHFVIAFFALLKINEMSLRVRRMVNALHTKKVQSK